MFMSTAFGMPGTLPLLLYCQMSYRLLKLRVSRYWAIQILYLPRLARFSWL